VEVLDKNDTPPSWPSKVQKLSISENAPVGQQIATLTATDEDTKGTIAYSIVTGNDSKFELDSVTGVLKIIDTLDREEEEEWTLTVRADDGVQSSDTQVSIMVSFLSIVARLIASSSVQILPKKLPLIINKIDCLLYACFDGDHHRLNMKV